MPFEIPENWVWTILGNIGEIITGTTPPKDNKEYYGGNIPFYKPTDLDGGIMTNYALDTLTDVGYEQCRKLPSESVLVTCIGATIGKVGVIRVAGACNQQINAIIPSTIVDYRYLYYALTSDFLQREILEHSSSTTLPIINKGKFSELPFPLPSLGEQNRIVIEVEKWLDFIADIEAEKDELELHIKKTTSKILDLAISGKLVPQDPNDESAIELLKRINPAFKPCDNSHYENLPQGWAICRLEDILDYEQPQAYIVNSTDYSDEYETPVLTAGKSFIIGYTNETNGICNRLPVIIFDDFTTDSKLVDFPFKVKSSAMKILRTKGEINIDYIAYYMSITRLIGDTHKRYWISEYSKLLIPIPPYQEQLRIVETIEIIFDKLHKITAELS